MYILYHSLVDSLISHGLSIYGLTFPVHINKIKSLQMRLLKLLIPTNAKDALKGNYEKLFKICKIRPIDANGKIAILTEQYNKTEFK
jgi:hypothetical protein